MVTLAPTSGGVAITGDSWHDYIYYTSGQLWTVVANAQSYAGAIAAL